MPLPNIFNRKKKKDSFSGTTASQESNYQKKSQPSPKSNQNGNAPQPTLVFHTQVTSELLVYELIKKLENILDIQLYLIIG